MSVRQIPFFSFSGMHPEIKDKMTKAFTECYDSNYFVLGKEITRFEKNWATFCTTDHAASVANGLEALIISLQALGIKDGDEVIVPSNTYIATCLAVTAVGAKWVAVEPSEDTFNIDVDKIEAAISDRTKCIIPVHLYGQCCEMDHILALAKKYSLFIVEDNAQSQGSTYRGKLTGSFGDANATSFYPGKNLGALGEAGAITTSQPELFSKLCAIRNYGSHQKYYNKYIGKNGRMDELQAYFLNVKLPYLNDWSEQRKAIAKKYNELLVDLQNISTPTIASHVESVYHQYVIKCDRRDELQVHLKEQGIGTLIHYPVPPHLQECYSDLSYKTGDFPIAESLSNRMLSLPIYPGLHDEDQVYIANKITEFYNQ